MKTCEDTIMLKNNKTCKLRSGNIAFKDFEIVRMGTTGDGNCLIHSVLKTLGIRAITRKKMEALRNDIADAAANLTNVDLGNSNVNGSKQDKSSSPRHFIQSTKRQNRNRVRAAMGDLHIMDRSLTTDALALIANYFNIGVMVVTKVEGDLLIVADLPQLCRFSDHVVVVYWVQTSGDENDNGGNHYEAVGLYSKKAKNIMTVFHKNHSFINALTKNMVFPPDIMNHCSGVFGSRRDYYLANQ